MAIIGITFLPATEQVITAEDQPLAGWHRQFRVPRTVSGGLLQAPAKDNIDILALERNGVPNDQDRLLRCAGRGPTP